MSIDIKLKQIPKDKYSDYKLDVIFNAYKWDPQVGDQNTVSKSVVLLSKADAQKLSLYAESLAAETVQAENILLSNLKLAKDLSLTKKLLKPYKGINFDQNKNVRLMRFDFHPCIGNEWLLSEVNSDVPGGLSEAAVLPHLAAHFFDGYTAGENVGKHIKRAFKQKMTSDYPVAFVHATAYADDRQVMQFLSDYFNKDGIKTLFAAPDHIEFKDKKAYSILEGAKTQLGGLIRFYPLEWLPLLPKHADFTGFYDTDIPCCNHPVALLTQSKRLPLIWDKLNIDLKAWKALLPKTIDVKSAKNNPDFIFKPAFGRVGGGITIKESLTHKEYTKTVKIANKNPKDWIAQKKFESMPIFDEGEKINKHLCIGVFTVDGRAAGFYGRISSFLRIDHRAEDIPVLVEE